ncbi:MAG: adenylosuccinate lyase, partial [Candidatus Hadarchaeota archaeon]
ATALQIKAALKIVERDLKKLLGIILRLAKNHKNTVMVGRTHGQHAVPTTLGMKLAVWASELGRQLERLEQLKPRVLVGKMSGAVGTGAAWGEKAIIIQELVMKELGLGAAKASNQILQRDRLAELMSFFGLLASTLEKMAREVRNLQRTDIGELAEPFAEGQVGSSTMPHKRNPIRCEKICGLARVVRANAGAALENMVLEHERDLTNSACERVILPESFLLMDEMLKSAIKVFDGLRVFPENMRRNLEHMKGLNMAEAVMIELTKGGASRQEAHALLRKCTSKAIEKNSTLLQILLKEPQVTRIVPAKRLQELMDPAGYLGAASAVVEQIVKELSPLTG